MILLQAKKIFNKTLTVVTKKKILSKIKNICLPKGIISRVNGDPRNERRCLQHTYPAKGSNNEEDPKEKHKFLNNYFERKDIQMYYKYMKRS